MGKGLGMMMMVIVNRRRVIIVYKWENDGSLRETRGDSVREGEY